MKSPVLVCILLVCGFRSVVHADGQTSNALDSGKLKLVDQPLPPGPVLLRAPDPSIWTITYTYADADTPKTRTGAPPVPAIPRIVQLQVTKNGNAWHEVQTYSSGATRSTWHIGTLQLNPGSEPGKYAIYDPSSFGRDTKSPFFDPFLYTDYSQSDFPDIKWISRGNYAGVTTLNDAPCLVFKKVGKTPDQSVVALIDPSTHLPLMQQNGDATSRYRFGPAAPDAQAIPPDIMALLAQRAAVIKELTTRVPSY